MNRPHVSQAELVGRLGQKPELEETGEGVKYAKLNIATSERYTDRGGAIVEKTEWTRAVAWGPLAEQIAGRFDKGDSVTLAGSMRINSYEKDGAKNRIIELHVDSAEPNPDKTISRNDARLVGVVRSAETKHLDSGTPMTVLSIGTTTSQNGKDREDWHSVTLWGKTAEAGAKEIAVGDTISVNGSVRHRAVPGPEGVERRLSAVDGRQFQVLERNRDRGQEAPGREKTLDRPAPEPPAPARTRSRGRGKGVERGM
jgi:single-strand DNA-binding protein